MQEKLKDLQKKILEYWNKWSTKQKSIIIGAFAGLILVIGLLVFLLGRTRYTELYRFETTEGASKAVSTLKDNNIASKLGDDKMTVMVDEKKYVDAIVTVSGAGIEEDGFGINDMLDTSITTTNGERLLRKFLRNESEMEKSIVLFKGVRAADVTFFARDTSNSILANNQTTKVTAFITTTSAFEEEEAEAIAELLAAGVGNSNTDDVTIVDQNGKVLYNGPEDESDKKIDFTDKLATQEFLKEQYSESVVGALCAAGYTDVIAMPNLVINFDRVEKSMNEVIPINGEDYGVIVQREEVSSTGSSGNGDVVGTDPNDETDYMLLNGGAGNSTYNREQYDYEPSRCITNTIYDVGVVVRDDCSISVVATRVVSRTERELKILGLLDDMSFEEYSIRNTRVEETPAPNNMITVISLATGIDEENVELVTFDSFQFIPEEKTEVDITTIVQIVLAVLLFVVLLFVILRGLKPVEVTEVEPELSIEQLLATTRENQGLEEVEFSEASETRKMIEKFFDENPEAVASLLRNWLNEDWS
ncbi:MAG: hypothetical protein MJ124_02150 [Lachnospiraceae bacterium]|nr:hypothetical protein [Lachnospiraceae bacterium]